MSFKKTYKKVSSHELREGTKWIPEKKETPSASDYSYISNYNPSGFFGHNFLKYNSMTVDSLELSKRRQAAPGLYARLEQMEDDNPSVGLSRLDEILRGRVLVKVGVDSLTSQPKFKVKKAIYLPENKAKPKDIQKYMHNAAAAA